MLYSHATKVAFINAFIKKILWTKYGQAYIFFIFLQKILIIIKIFLDCNLYTYNYIKKMSINLIFIQNID
ncbi:hypothetical protein KLA_03182 [Cellulophaga geojensis KL-A]|uniref:Uncharacterized protein n=1 Tax=Cellulophaga geojensis KL-A TaxID=1328323 RepID=A0ABN0RS63_9FLAO|nr:hypothetical protein KLA_03182 [Cellulophaga geojensis KL-A]